MDNLEKLFKENDLEGFFSASLKELNLARAQKDQKKVDLIFRLLRGAVFLLGHEYGESERKNEVNSIEASCSCCGAREEETKLVGFAKGFLCSKCANLMVKELENA